MRQLYCFGVFKINEKSKGIAKIYSFAPAPLLTYYHLSEWLKVFGVESAPSTPTETETVKVAGAVVPNSINLIV